MARVKRAVGAHKKRRKIIKLAKGYMWGRKNRYTLAKDAVRHALVRAYIDRRKKKRRFPPALEFTNQRGRAPRRPNLQPVHCGAEEK